MFRNADTDVEIVILLNKGKMEINAFEYSVCQRKGTAIICAIYFLNLTKYVNYSWKNVVIVRNIQCHSFKYGPGISLSLRT